MGYTNNLRVVLSLLLSAFACADLSADENRWEERHTINGFYSLDLTYADDTIPVVSNGNIPRILEGEKSTLKNSVFGLQAEFKIFSNLSAFLQGSAFYDQQNEFDKSLDWAYLSYDPGNNYNIRLGRFLLPFLQGAELKSVGYSRLWARPLVPGSGTGGFIDHRGVELIKRIPLEDSFFSLQFSLGKPKHHHFSVDGKHLGLISVKYERDDFWLRGAMALADYETFTQQSQIIDDSARADMFSLETEARFLAIVINAGLSDLDTEITPDDMLFYISFAYPTGPFTPYIVASRTSRSFEPSTDQASPVVGVGSPPQRIGDVESETLSIGFRYDFDGTYALKTQIEHIEIVDDTDQRRGRVESQANIFTVLLEGVF